MRLLFETSQLQLTKITVSSIPMLSLVFMWQMSIFCRFCHKEASLHDFRQGEKILPKIKPLALNY